ncbi:MAG TPA: hypothetical protein VK928_10925, partial [Longimicrobiales bacterium]|nr:hypothetical protein [Longimicrobiales bacterium]
MRLLTAGCVVLALSGCAGAARQAPSGEVRFPDADTVRVTPLAPGIEHTFVHHPAGPWAVHVVRIDSRCMPGLRARKPGRDLGARATTSEIAGNAPVAINADFFMLPGGTPVGAHVEGGVPLIGPTDRPVFAVTAQGWEIGVGRMHGFVRTRGDSVRIAQVNRPSSSFSAYGGTRDGVTLITAWMGDSIPADSAGVRLTLRAIDGNAASGRGVVTGPGGAAPRAALQPGTVVLHAHGDARAWAARRVAGDPVSWTAEVRVSSDAPAREAVGGFPELIRDGRDVLAGQVVRAEFGAARHPRTALGWTAAG